MGPGALAWAAPNYYVDGTAKSTAPLCGLARALILTGPYAFRTGATNQDSTGLMKPGVETIYVRNDAWACGKLPQLRRIIARDIASPSTRRRWSRCRPAPEPAAPAVAHP